MSNLKVHTGASNGHSPGSYYRESKLAVIDPNDKEGLEKWASILEISTQDLLKAIDTFGPAIREIRRGLNSKSQDDEAA